MKYFIPITFLLLISSCDGGQSNRDTNPLHLPPDGFVGDSKQGAVLYNQSCSQCHGIVGQGSHQGPPLVHKTYKPGHHADLAFNLAVKNGVRSHHWRFGDMPPLPNVSPEDITNIVVYVRELQRNSGIE